MAAPRARVIICAYVGRFHVGGIIVKRMIVHIGVLLLLTALLPLVAGVGAQPAPLTLELSGVNALELPRVELTANVYDALGQPINGLTAANFSLSGALAEHARIVSVQNIASNALPFATVLVIDASESMAGEPIERARDAARAYVEQVRESDPVAVIAFGSTVRVLQDFTTDKALLLAAIDSIGLLGRTALYQAAFEGINLAKDSPVPRRTVILLSDGSEYGNLSTATPDDVVEDAFLHGVPAYTIGLGFGADRTFLQSLAGETLAQYYESPTADELLDIYETLANRLSSQYIITLDVNVPLDGAEYEFTLTAEHEGNTASQSGTVRAPIPVPIVDLSGLPVEPIAEVTGLAIDVRADQALTRVVESLGGVVVADLDAPPYTLQIDPEQYPPGPLALDVSATDVDGDTGSGSAMLEIAALPPRISLSQDLAEMGAIGEPVEVSVVAGGQTPITEVRLSVNAADPAVLDAPYSFTLDPLALLPGDNQLVVTARNEAGLEVTLQTDFAVADVPPVVSVDGLTDGQSVDAPVSFSVGAVSQSAVAEVSAAINGAPLDAQDGVFTVDPIQVRPGAAGLAVSATTDRGQTGEAAITLMIAPLPPVLSVDGLSDGDTVTSSVDLTINAQAQTPITQGQVQVNGETVGQFASTPVTISVPFSAMQPGANTVTIQAQSAGGQPGALALTVTVPAELFTPTPNAQATGTASAFAASTRTAVAQAAADLSATQSAVTQAVQTESAATQSAATQSALTQSAAQTVTAEANAIGTQAAGTQAAETQTFRTQAAATAVAQAVTIAPTATTVPPSATPIPASATSARATSDAPATVQAAAALVQQAATRAHSTVEAQQSATAAAQASAQAQATRNAQATQEAVAQSANATTTAVARATAQVSTNQTATALSQGIQTATAQAGRAATAAAQATTAAQADASATANAADSATALASTQAVGTANAQAAGETATARAEQAQATAGAQATRTARAVFASQTAQAVTAQPSPTTAAADATPTPQPTLTPVEAESAAGGGTTAMLWIIFVIILLIAIALVILITRARKRRMEP